MSKKKDGCAIFMRRSFLFLIGLAIAKLLKEYFSLSQNRANFWSFLQLLQRKYISWRNGEPLLNNTQSNPPEELPAPTIKQEPQVKSNDATENAKSAPIEENNLSPRENSLIKGEPVKFELKTLFGVSFHQATIDLKDPETFITIALANDPPQANTNQITYGDESFVAMVNRAQAAVAINGTFFSKDQEKRVMGNMVAGGKFLKYSQWENYATTLGIKAGNKLEMITAREEGQPDWSQHWFSLTCGTETA